MVKSSAWETGLLEEIIRKQFAELSTRGRFSPGTTLNNANKASPDLEAAVKGALGLTSGTVMAALEVCTHGLSVKQCDVVKFKSQQGREHVGYTCFHVKVDKFTLTCVRPLVHVRGNRYKMCDEHSLIDTFSIVDTCAYYIDQQGLAVVL